MKSLFGLILLDNFPLWFIFCGYFFNFFTALKMKVPVWKTCLFGLLFFIVDLGVYVVAGLKAEKLSFILVVLLVVSPLIWRATTDSFIKIASVCLVLTGLHLSFTISSDVLFPFICKALFGEQVISVLLTRIIAYITQLLMCVFLNLCLRTTLAHRIIDHLFQTKNVSRITFINTLLMTAVVMSYFYFYYEWAFGGVQIRQFLLGIYLFFGLSFGLIIGISSYIRLYQDKLKFAESMLEQQQAYNRVLEEVQQDIRHFQHDYKNILSSFYLQLKEGKLKEAQELLEAKFLSFDKNVSFTIKQLNFLNNIKSLEVKSLLMTKMLQMEQKKIKLDIEVVDEIAALPLDSEDLVRCLGILLDNAMEEEVLAEEKSVHFLAYQESETVTIIVMNHLGRTRDFSQITQEGYSTKGNARGLGLNSYQKILSKYPNVFTKTVISEEQFQQVLKIQM
ncbi:histidine kinase [Enterococcus florum]|uniref:Histidine kinase n=1 Tax=Enterococcus florum TaxID=2480627 RepID=A0A4P5P6Y5_9ENTE|nr:GHKL domain-containing protein [Enterococcus florum]GCF93186.1 histidine kinase [Enterococcus florum]